MTLQFGTAQLNAETRKADPGLDVALLEITNATLPPELSHIELGSIRKAAINLARLGWDADGYPAIGGGAIVPMTGNITSLTDEGLKLEIDGITNEKIVDPHDPELTRLSGASGAAIRCRGRAVGLFNQATLGTSWITATPMDRVADVIPKVKELLRADEYPMTLPGTRHLECDRDDQWSAFTKALEKDEACGLLLYGAATEEPEMFLSRIRALLRRKNDSWGRYVEVTWRDCWSTQDFLGALSHALAAHSEFEYDRLPRLLVSAIDGARHVIVHPVFDMARGEEVLEPLIDYYKELPRLLEPRSGETGKGPVFIQPITWSSRDDRQPALKLVEQLREAWGRFSVLKELLTFTDQHLLEAGLIQDEVDAWRRLPRPTTGAAYRMMIEKERRKLKR